MKRITTIVLFVIVVGVLSLQVASIASADMEDGWCQENSDISKGTDDVCLRKTWDSLTEQQRSDIGGYSNFVGKAQECLATGSYYGLSQNDGGSCANAVKYCVTRALNFGGCTTERIGSLAKGCNNGKGTEAHECAIIKDINKPIVEAKENEFKDRISATCKTEGGEDASTSTDSKAGDAMVRCEKAAASAQKYCSSAELQPMYNSSDTLWNHGEWYMDLGAYSNCLEDEMRKNSQSEPECTARGGYWIESDTIDPDVNQAQRNTTEKGCHVSLREMNNPAACAAQNDRIDGGTEWVKINDSPNHWECQPKNKSLDPEDPNGDTEKLGVNDFASLNSGLGKCGESKTNIIICSSDSGSKDEDKPENVLSNVLRIFVIVLSFGVGIAAVASIAYSAIRYAGARDNQGDVSLARERIRNTVIGLLLYGFLIAIANWLVPGGIL